MSDLPIIEQSDYLAGRLNPRPGHYLYLHLSDLLMALKGEASDQPIRVLDFGCGGSPYRSLFPSSHYARADIPLTSDLDFVIQDDGTVNAPSNTFDLVLSTQVAEHVQNPSIYFSECYRVLKPGGRLICSTHGFFEEHGCPFDFQRWTLEGLQRDIKQTGFVISKAAKLTTGARCGIFFIDCGVLQANSRDVLGFMLTGVRVVHKLLRPLTHRLCDQYLSGHRVVTQSLDAHRWYCGVFVVAQKPA